MNLFKKIICVVSLCCLAVTVNADIRLDESALSIGSGAIQVDPVGSTGKYYLWQLNDSLDERSGMPGTVFRDSAAYYVDTDGILQVADGDATPFSHASIEDETGYTDIRGSFVDGQAWFDGVVLGSEEITNEDFANWTGVPTDDTPDDWTVVADDANNYVTEHADGARIVSNGTTVLELLQGLTFTVGLTYKITFTKNNHVSGAIRWRNPETLAYENIVGSDSNGTYTCYITAVGTTLKLFRDYKENTDYVLNSVSVKEVQASLADQAGTGNLLIIDDTAAKGYGYIGEVGTGETATALANDVTQITKANPGVVSSVAHGLVVGDLVYFDSLTEMTELNTTYKNVTAVGSADLFSINDTSGYGAAETTGGAAAHEVTEPSATAVKIYKEYELTNEGWNALDTGLDYNAAAWEFDVYTNLLSATGSTAQARFEANGYLSEWFESTNYCLQSNDFSEWLSEGGVTELKDETGPDGVVNSAWTVTDPGGTAWATLRTDVTSSITGIYTESVFVKEGTSSNFSITIYQSSGGVARGQVHFEWTTGVPVATNVVGTSTVQQLGSTDWWRVQIHGPSVLAGYKHRFYIYPTKQAVDPGTAKTIILYGAQFEPGTVASSYIPTTTIPVTRTIESNAWTMSTAFKNLMGDVADSPFTMVCEWTPKYSYTDTAGNENILAVRNEANTLMYHRNDGLFASRDGVNSTSVDPDYVADTTYIFALRVFLDGTMKIECGEKHGGVWTWDATPGNYDGSYNPATEFLIGYLNALPFNVKNIYFYDSAKTQAWIEAKYNASIYGVAWDENADTYTRTDTLADEAVSQTLSDSLLPVHAGMKRCVINDSGVVQYYLDADDSRLKSDGVTASDLTGADGQVMVQIPKFYYKYDYSGTTHTWRISPVSASGFTLHPAFVKNGSNVDYRYIGAYEGIGYDDSVSAYIDNGDVKATGWSGTTIDLANDILSSVSGKAPISDETRSEFRAIAANRGTGWRQQDYDLVSAIQLLYLIEYADWNSQTMIGSGRTQLSGGTWVQDSYMGVTGKSNADGNGTNSVAGNTNDAYMTYRGIENFFGNIYQWVDGININENVPYVSNTDTDFADDTVTDYTDLGITLSNADGYAVTLEQQNRGFLPASVGGSSSTYLTDYYYQSTGWRVGAFGGYAYSNTSAGVSCWRLIYSSDVDFAGIGGRLCF